MKTILLGAGASKSYSVSPTGSKMPIANDFFATYNSLEISSDIWVLVGDILNVAREEKGIGFEDFFSSNLDIEEFHSFVEQKLLSVLHDELKIERIHYWKAYLQLVFLFSSVVNEIQNGPVSKTHVALSSSLSKEDVILTFNWDTLMDRALSESKNWNVDNGYGRHPKKVFRNEWVSPNIDNTFSGPTLLKLHGSSNWITSYPQYDPVEKRIALSQVSSPETFYVYEKTDKPYSTYAGRFRGPYEPFSYFYYPPNLIDDTGKPAPDGHIHVRMRMKFPWDKEGSGDDGGLVTMPLIIPPVKEKNYNLFGSLFSELWNKAADNLIKTDVIIIIGYSFPRTDLKSISMFKDAFMKRKTMPKIIIVNPNPERIEDLFRMEFGIDKNHIRIIKEYFDESFDFSKLNWS